jgi:hypothetical protein
LFFQQIKRFSDFYIFFIKKPHANSPKSPVPDQDLFNLNPRTKLNSALPGLRTLSEVSILVPELEHLNGGTLSVGVLQTEKVLNYTRGKSNAKYLQFTSAPTPLCPKKKYLLYKI